LCWLLEKKKTIQRSEMPARRSETEKKKGAVVLASGRKKGEKKKKNVNTTQRMRKEKRAREFQVASACKALKQTGKKKGNPRPKAWRREEKKDCTAHTAERKKKNMAHVLRQHKHEKKESPTISPKGGGEKKKALFP